MTRKYTSYRDLLAHAGQEADTFSLVWRNLAFDASAFELLEKLSPWLVSDFSASSWPGTRLIGQKARVRTYQVNASTMEILKCVDSVFELNAPGYPEDLAFYKGKSVIFSSVAHEGEAWFENV